VAGLQPAQRRVGRRELFPGPFEQRGRVLPLEGQRRALGIVLVVCPARARRLRESRELPLQGGHLPHRTRPLRQQQFARVSHLPDDSGTQASPSAQASPPARASPSAAKWLFVHGTGGCGHEGLAG